MDEQRLALSLNTLNTMTTEQAWFTWLEALESEPELFESPFDYDRFMDDDDEGNDTSAIQGLLSLTILKALSVSNKDVLLSLGNTLITLNDRPLWQKNRLSWLDIYNVLVQEMHFDEASQSPHYPSWWYETDDAFSLFFHRVWPDHKETSRALSVLDDSVDETSVLHLAQFVFWEMLSAIGTQGREHLPFTLSSLNTIRQQCLKSEQGFTLHLNDAISDMHLEWEAIFGQRDHVPQTCDYLVLMLLKVFYQENAKLNLTFFGEGDSAVFLNEATEDMYRMALTIPSLMAWETFSFTPQGLDGIAEWVKSQLDRLLASPDIDSEKKAWLLKLWVDEPIII